MAQLPVNRTTSNTPADHIADHNEIHRLHDILDGSAGPSQALATLDGRYSSLATVILSNQTGIDPTGATDCAAALQTVINATAAAGKQLLWDCKVLTSATVITLPTNADIVGCGWSTSQLIGGWTLTSTGGYYITNADRNNGNTGIRVRNLQITGAGNGTPWGNTTNPVVGFALARCSDFEISCVRAYHIPGISFSGQSCFHGKWDVDVYGSGRDGLNNTYIGGEMHDLTIDINAYLIGDDGVTVNSSPTGGPLNGTAVTVATTAGSNAIVASAPTSPVWTTGQTIVIAGAASGGLALEATLHVVDSTHATLMIPGGTESTIGTPAVLSVGAASAWYGVYRPYNIVIRSFDIYGQPAMVTQGAGRGIYIAGSDVTLGNGVINSTYSSGIRIQSDFVTTALYSKMTAGNVVIRNAGAVGGGTSSQPRDGVNIDGALSVEFSSLRIDQHYNRGIYATHCINLQCGSAHISNGGQASIDFGIDLDGITGTNYQVDTVNLNGLIVEGQSGNGIRCNMARRVTINGTIKNNGRLKAGTVNDWGILYIGDATTEATISGVITDTRAAGQKTQLGPVFIQTPGAPFVLFTNLIAYGNINTDISSTGAAVVLRRNVLSHGTTLTANYDQDSTGAKHYTAPLSPQGVITAPVGSTYRQTDGTAGAMLWTKTSGTGNTGWTSLATTLSVVATVAVAGTLVVNAHTPVNATSAPLTMTLPTGQPQGSLISAEKTDGSANVVTISGNISGIGSSTLTLVLQHETALFEADAAGSWWVVAGYKALAGLDGRYSSLAGAHPKASAISIEANAATVAAPSTGNTYASFPGTIDTQSGDLLVGYRLAAAHASGATPGLIMGSRSIDGGVTWSTPATIYAPPVDDPRDPCFYRVPGTRRIYLHWHSELINNGAVTGLWIIWSDDDGVTWSAPHQIAAGLYGGGTPMHQKSTGVFYLPCYLSVAGLYKATAFTATDPTGTWTAAPDVYVPGGGHATEWDYAAVSPTNWIGIVRNDPTSQMVVVQSTDEGLTWSAPTTLPAMVGNCTGWPRPVLLDDGRLLLFFRFGGLDVAQLLNTAAPLTAGNWTLAPVDPYTTGNGGVGLDGNNDSYTNSGKFDPVRLGSSYVGAYYSDFAGVAPAKIRLLRFNPAAFRWGHSYIATDESTLSTSYVLLTTPDAVTVMSSGGMYEVRWDINSYSSATIENWQCRIYLDGVAQAGELDGGFGAVAQSTTSGYYNTRGGVLYLRPGIRTIDLRYSVGTGTQPRHFRYRSLMVKPL